MGQLWDAPAPQGCNFYPFEVWSYRACQSLQMWQISNFCEIHFELRGVKFFAMLSLCVFLGRYFAPGANIVPPIAYKSHSTPFPIRPHILTPHSWLCGKNCGRSSAPKLVRANSNYYTRMYISRRKCEMVLAVAKNTTRLLGGCGLFARRLLGCSGWLLGRC